MAEAGALRPGASVELLNGRINDISLIGPFHGGLVNRLIRIYAERARGRWQASAQNPLRLDDHSEPQPDFMFLKPSPDDYTDQHARPEDVILLIEVSDTTLDYDHSEKLPAYGQAGVTEVWIVNVPEATIEVYREPHFTGYGSKTVVGGGRPGGAAGLSPGVH